MQRQNKGRSGKRKEKNKVKVTEEVIGNIIVSSVAIKDEYTGGVLYVNVCMYVCIKRFESSK